MRADKGFTLLEVLIALAIFSTAILGLGRMQLAANSASVAAGRLSRATAVAQDKAEQLLTLPYTHALLADTTPAAQWTTYTEANPPTGYQVTWQVNTDTPRTDVKTINLTVTWKNRDKAKTYTLAVYKYQD